MFAAIPIFMLVIIGIVVLFVLFAVFTAGNVFFKDKFGQNGHRAWLVICAAFVIAIASAIIFPLHHGDGRSNSYNDGWYFVARLPAGDYFQMFGHASSCPSNWAQQTHFSEPIVIGTQSPYGNNYPGDNRREWIQGCEDAATALWNEQQQVTIPVKE